MTNEPPTDAPGRRLVVYEWCTGDRFLAQVLFPGAIRLMALSDAPADALVAHWPKGCDRLLFQVNLSRTERFPARRQELIRAVQERGVRVLNAHLDDIRKSTLHRMLARLGLNSAAASREGDGDEPLMVKTDFNYGGLYERLLSPEERRHLGVSAEEIPISDWNDYRVMPRREVPDAFWSDPTLVIERFIDNPDGRFYRVYGVGDRVVIVEAHGTGAVKKISDDPRDVNYTADLARLAEIDRNGALPLALVRVIEAFLLGTGLDLGSFDIMDDGAGGFYVVDLNLTPFGGGSHASDEVLDHLRGGLS